MKWIKRTEKEPEHHPILVFCKKCLKTHSVIFDHDEWGLFNSCDEKGPYFLEQRIDFDYWMPLPEPPQ